MGGLCGDGHNLSTGVEFVALRIRKPFAYVVPDVSDEWFIDAAKQVGSACDVAILHHCKEIKKAV